MPRRRVKGERETISWRDWEVLEFICRFGVVSRASVFIWAGTGRSATLDRERRLRETGLIEVHPPIGRSGPIIAATLRGLRVCDRTELGPARVSVWSANHTIVCARVAASLEARGDRVFSEREVAYEERRLGERSYSARRRDRERGWHRPDLIRSRGENDDAIEVELTEKAPERLQSILRAWQDKKIETSWPERILYLCPPKSLRFVERAVKKAGAGWAVEVHELAFDTTPFPRPESQASGGLGDGRQPPKGSGRSPLAAAPPPLLSRPGRLRDSSP